MSNSIELSESTLDDLKLTLVSLAKTNVNRLYMLNSYLSDIEEKIIDKAHSEDIPLRDLLEIYSSIRASVNDMSKLIQQITSDPTITSIIIQNTQIINQVSASKSDVLDKESRQKVKAALAQILGSSDAVVRREENDIIEG